MRHQSPSTRRHFLGLAGGAAVAGAIPLVTLRSAEATPATLAAAIRSVVGTAVVRMGKVKLDIPPLVENGNTVPMTVSVANAMTPDDHVKSIHVFNEKNPQPNIGNFHLGPRAGREGGEVVFEGTVKGLQKAKTLTGQHLDDRASLKPSVREPSGELEVRGAGIKVAQGAR